MRYSVYDYTRRVYDYYEAPGPAGTHAASPALVISPISIGSKWNDTEGMSPNRAGWKLPPGARKVGSGALPEGRIASMGEFDLSDPMMLVGFAVIAYLGWRALR